MDGTVSVALVKTRRFKNPLLYVANEKEGREMRGSRVKALKREAKNSKYYDKPLTTRREVYKELKRKYKAGEAI